MKNEFKEVMEKEFTEEEVKAYNRDHFSCTSANNINCQTDCVGAGNCYISCDH